MKKYEIDIKIKSDKEIKYSSHEICQLATDKFPIQKAIMIIEILGEFIASDVIKKRIIWVIDQNIKENYVEHEDVDFDFEQFVMSICMNVIKKHENSSKKIFTKLSDDFTKIF